MNRLRDLLITFSCRFLALLLLPFSKRRSPGRSHSYSFSSIVVFKPCCIGDVTLATPALVALRQAFPQARIAFAVSPWAIDAIRTNPRIDEIVDSGSVGSGRTFGWREYFSLVHRLRKGNYELAVVLERSPLLSLIPLLARIPHRAGIDSSGRGFSLTFKAPWRGNQHEAELYLDVVRALGVQTGKPSSEFYPSEADSSKAETILAQISNGRKRENAESKLAMIHPGGATNPGMILSAKRWPAERYASLAGRLMRDDWTVILAGADSDRTSADGVLAKIHREGGDLSSDSLVDLVGKLSLGEFAALAQRCRLFVGNDTGPMHVAAATGTPTVAIFGPSTPDTYAPYGPRSVAVYNRVSCSPCFVKGRFNTNCRDYKCMQAVEVEDVWQAIEQVLRMR